MIQQPIRQNTIPHPRICLSLVIALCGAFIAAPAALAVQFADDTFNLSDYATPLLYVNSAGPATVVPQQIATGGNPGTALQTLYTFPPLSAPLETFIGFIRPSFSYDPAISGPIKRIAVAADKFTTVNISTTPTTSIRPMILQNGQYFMSIITVSASQNTYLTLSNQNLGRADFTLFDFTTGTFDAAQHPDFTSSSMQFGFTSRFAIIGANIFDIHADLRFDNLIVEVVPVPEPATIALVAISGCGWISLRRRRTANEIQMADGCLPTLNPLD
jgi:hypothetical protein